MKSNIVYQYFKKEQGGKAIFIQVDPIQLRGSQLTFDSNGAMELEELEFGSDVLDNLADDDFLPANALEFHILLNGLR
jgi:hypothetical protein